MIIIIEGTDLVGKTQLAKKIDELSVHYDNRFRYRHLGPLPPDFTRKDYYPLMIDFSVLDRFFMSELAYGMTIRGSTFLTDDDIFDLESKLMEVGVFEVYCRASERRIADAYRWAEKTGRKELFSLDQILKVQKEYDKILDPETSPYSSVFGPDLTVDLYENMETDTFDINVFDDRVDEIARYILNMTRKSED